MQEPVENIARQFDELTAEGKELEDLVEVEASVSRSPGSVYSTRYSREEIALVRDAARKRGMTTSSFIRKAALAAAAGDLDLTAAKIAETLQEIKAKARDLAETAGRL